MDISEEPTNISSLNIFTFIKEIYQSIKNFHKKLNNITEEQKKIYLYLNKINTEHNLSIKRNYELLMNIQNTLNKRDSIDNSIMNNLNSKLGNLMIDTIQDDSDKVKLNIADLSIGNLVDNNYTMDDINQQLTNLDFKEESNLPELNKLNDVLDIESQKQMKIKNELQEFSKLLNIMDDNNIDENENNETENESNNVLNNNIYSIDNENDENVDQNNNNAESLIFN